MRKVTFTVILLLAALISACSNRTESPSTSPPTSESSGHTDPAIKDNEELITDKSFINKVVGTWVHENEEDMSLSLVDGIELIGITNGQLLTKATYEITEVNLKEQSIIIHGFSNEISYDEETPSVEFTSKLYLVDGGEKLVYVYDYLDTKIESTWIRTDS